MEKKAEDKKADRMIHVRLSPELHKRVRMRAAELDLKIQKFVENAIKSELERHGK